MKFEFLALSPDSRKLLTTALKKICREKLTYLCFQSRAQAFLVTILQLESPILSQAKDCYSFIIQKWNPSLSLTEQVTLYISKLFPQTINSTYR